MLGAHESYGRSAMTDVSEIARAMARLRAAPLKSKGDLALTHWARDHGSHHRSA